MGAVLDRFGQDLQGGGLIRPVSYPLVDLDARSSALLEPEYATRPWRAGMVQPFPTTAAGLATLLGEDAAAFSSLSPCTDPNTSLASVIAGPPALLGTGVAYERVAAGLAGGSSLAAKLAAEVLTSANGVGFLSAAGTSFGDTPAAGTTALGLVFRAAPGNAGEVRLMSKETGFTDTRWILAASATQIRVYVATSTFGGYLATVACAPFDGAWHCIFLTFKDADKSCSIVSDLGSGSGNYTGVLADAATRFALGSSGGFTGTIAQYAYLFSATVPLTAAHFTAFWRHALAAGLGSNFAYTRAAPWRVAGAPNRVFAYGAGQVAVGYHAGLVEPGNPDGLGIVEDGAATFLGINSANMPGWTAAGGPPPVLTAVDGPSGMRDALRIDDQQAATAGYALSGSGTLTGATNVPHTFGVWVQAVAAGGLNALITAYFSGDAGGAETLTVATLAGTVPAAWAQFTGTVTPTRAGHTSAVLRCYPTDGVAASTGTVDFAEPWGVQNRSTVPVAWLAVGAGAAVATAAPAPSFPNAAGQRYNPARGRLNANFVVSYIGSTVMRFAEFYSGGSLAGYLAGYVDNTGAVTVNLYDAAAILVASALSAAGVVVIGSLSKISVLWDARHPLPHTGGQRLAVVVGGALVATGGPAAWTPAAAAGLTAWMGNQSGGGGIYGAISRFEILSEPGSIYDEQ